MMLIVIVAILIHSTLTVNANKAMSDSKTELFSEENFNNSINSELNMPIAVYSYIIYTLVCQKEVKNKHAKELILNAIENDKSDLIKIYTNFAKEHSDNTDVELIASGYIEDVVNMLKEREVKL